MTMTKNKKRSDERMYQYYGCPDCECREIELIEHLKTCWVDDVS